MLWAIGNSDVSDQIDAILDRAMFKGAILGVSVETLEGESIYSRNPELLLMPASNQKVLSVAYALWKLGPEFVPVTRFWKTSNGLVIDAPGDPSMTYDRLIQIRKQLGPAPRKKVLVNQGFRPGFGPGWEWDDLPNRYAPTISAFSFSTGSFELWGAPGKLWIRPNPFGIKIVHTPWKSGPNVFDLASKRLEVHAQMPRSSQKMEGFAYPNPDHLAAQILGGNLAPTKSLPKTDPTLSVRGKNIADLAKDCLEPSDNFIAECMLLMAARAEGELPADEFGEAAKRLKSFLVKTVGLDPNEVDPYDGSGLSRHNNVSPSGLVKVLAWAKKQPWADVWTGSLAAPGAGTLKNRLQNSGFRGKTGTLDKASSLSGYVQCKDGRELVVSIMMNHYLSGDSAARGAQDEIIRVLEGAAKNGPQLASRQNHADTFPEPNHRLIHDDRIRRPYLNRLASSARLDR